MDIYHIVPINDLQPHTTESVSDYCYTNPEGDLVCEPSCACLCSPKREQENGIWFFVHNSFDGREGLEWARDLLGI